MNSISPIMAPLRPTPSEVRAMEAVFKTERQWARGFLKVAVRAVKNGKTDARGLRLVTAAAAWQPDGLVARCALSMYVLRLTGSLRKHMEVTCAFLEGIRNRADFDLGKGAPALRRALDVARAELAGDVVLMLALDSAESAWSDAPYEGLLALTEALPVALVRTHRMNKGGTLASVISAFGLVLAAEATIRHSRAPEELAGGIPGALATCPSPRPEGVERAFSAPRRFGTGSNALDALWDAFRILETASRRRRSPLTEDDEEPPPRAAAEALALWPDQCKAGRRLRDAAALIECVGVPDTIAPRALATSLAEAGCAGRAPSEWPRWPLKGASEKSIAADNARGLRDALAVPDAEVGNTEAFLGFVAWVLMRTRFPDGGGAASSPIAKPLEVMLRTVQALADQTQAEPVLEGATAALGTLGPPPEGAEKGWAWMEVLEASASATWTDADDLATARLFKNRRAVVEALGAAALPVLGDAAAAMSRFEDAVRVARAAWCLITHGVRVPPGADNFASFSGALSGADGESAPVAFVGLFALRTWKQAALIQAARRTEGAVRDAALNICVRVAVLAACAEAALVAQIARRLGVSFARGCDFSPLTRTEDPLAAAAAAGAVLVLLGETSRSPLLENWRSDRSGDDVRDAVLRVHAGVETIAASLGHSLASVYDMSGDVTAQPTNTLTGGDMVRAFSKLPEYTKLADVGREELARGTRTSDALAAAIREKLVTKCIEKDEWTTLRTCMALEIVLCHSE